jgi:hypothetical protein
LANGRFAKRFRGLASKAVRATFTPARGAIAEFRDHRVG